MVDTFKIEKNIPIPKNTQTTTLGIIGKVRDSINILESGESFFVPVNKDGRYVYEKNHMQMRIRIRSYIKNHITLKKNEFVVEASEDGSGCRVWRK